MSSESNKVFYLSPSKLEQARLCRYRMKAKAEDAEYEEEYGEPALGGTLAHEAAKFWYRDQVDQKLTPDAAFEKAMTAVSQAKDYDGNPASQLPREASTIEEARVMFTKIISQYPREKVKVVFVERKYKGRLKNGVPVNLIIDLGLDMGDGKLRIVDYKTGYLVTADDELMDKDQVLLNLVAVMDDQELVSFSRFEFVYFWVRSGHESKPVSITWEFIKDYTYFLALEYQRILDDKNPEPTINRFCGSCGVRKTCPKYSAFLAEAYGCKTIDDAALISPDQAANLTNDELLARFDRLGAQLKQLEKNKKTLGDAMVGRIKEAGTGEELYGEKLKGKPVVVKRQVYSDGTVKRLITQRGKDPLSIAKFSQTEVDKAFANDPEAMSQLQLTASRIANAPYMSVSALPLRKQDKKSKAKNQPSQEGNPE